jgi:hypothetical protein
MNNLPEEVACLSPASPNVTDSRSSNPYDRISPLSFDPNVFHEVRFHYVEMMGLRRWVAALTVARAVSDTPKLCQRAVSPRVGASFEMFEACERRPASERGMAGARLASWRLNPWSWPRLEPDGDRRRISW